MVSSSHRARPVSSRRAIDPTNWPPRRVTDASSRSGAEDWNGSHPICSTTACLKPCSSMHDAAGPRVKVSSMATRGGSARADAVASSTTGRANTGRTVGRIEGEVVDFYLDGSL